MGHARCLIPGVLFAGFAWASGLPPEDPSGTARAQIAAGRFAEAERSARDLLAGATAAHGAGSVEAARAIDLLVQALRRGTKAADPETRRLAEDAVRIKETALGHDDPELAVSLGQLAGLLEMTGNPGDARPLLERALAIREKAFGPDHPDVAASQHDLANLISDLGDFAGATTLYERSLAIREKAFGPDSPEVASSLHNLALMKFYTGDYAAARRLGKEALALRERILGPDHPDVANTLGNLGMVLARAGDVAGARRLQERALAIREKSMGRDHPAVAVSLNDLAYLLAEEGDYAGARPLLERALRINERSLGTGNLGYAWSLSLLANLSARMGDVRRARALFERARAIRERVSGPDSLDAALSEGHLGGLLLEAGDAPSARPHLEKALAIREKALGPDHLDVAASLSDLGSCLTSTGEIDRARPLFERAIAIFEKAGDPDSPHLAVCLMSYGHLLALVGDEEASRRSYARGIAMEERVHGADPPVVAEALDEMARLALASGEREGALRFARRAETIARAHFVRTARALAEREALRYERIRTSGLDVALSELASSRSSDLPPGTAESVWDEVVRSRAMVLDEMACRQRAALENGDPEMVARRAALEVARNRLARLALSGPQAETSEAYLERLREAQEDEERSERDLARRSAIFREQRERSALGLEEVRDALPQDGALVAYIEYARPAPAAPSRSSASHAASRARPVLSYLAFVLRPAGAGVAWVPLGPVGAIDDRVRRWRRSAGSSSPGLAIAGRAAEARARDDGERLRRAIWDPLRDALGAARVVFVVPDGLLTLVNFAALPVGPGSYLVEEGPLVQSLSAERDLAARAAPWRRGEGLLVVGGPNYEARSASSSAPPGPSGGRVYRGPRSACGDFRRLRFRPLAASVAEAEAIARLWTEERAFGGGDVLLLTRGQAAEGTFKRAAAGRRILHLATHAFFAQDRCGSALQAQREAAWTAGMATGLATSARDNPLLLSGLALAGANGRDRAGRPSDDDDGILTAEEIASLDLSGVEWVVLSACETGVGEVQAGEGILGLRRAFEVAGARTLIMSLWAVDDAAARDWMRALYAARLGGATTAEAVRDASLRIITMRRKTGRSTHPFFWGAFVAAGDWR